MSIRVDHAKETVNACLNYGGVYHDGGPTTKQLELTCDHDALYDEVPQIRRLAMSLIALADALEATGGHLSSRISRGLEVGSSTEALTEAEHMPNPSLQQAYSLLLAGRAQAAKEVLLTALDASPSDRDLKRGLSLINKELHTQYLTNDTGMSD